MSQTKRNPTLPVTTQKLHAGLRVIAFNFFVLVLCAVMLLQNPHRWPVIIVIAAILVCANIFVYYRREIVAKWTSMILMVAYAFGLVGGMAWCLVDFYWWKVVILFVPLFFMIKHLNAVKKRGAAPD